MPTSPPFVPTLTDPSTIKLAPLVLNNPFGEPELPDHFVWTSSSLKLFRRCKRKFYWKYIFRLRSRYKQGSFIIGHAFHNALADWYKSKRSTMDRIAVRYVEQSIKELRENNDFFDSDEAAKTQQQIDCLSGMLRGYADVYAEDRDEWKIDRKGIEVEFQVNCGDYSFHGKIDGLFNRVPKGHKTMKPFLIEHKTASRIDGSYTDRLPMDTQCRAYMFGAEYGLGVKPHDVLYDVVSKSKLRRKANESLAEFSARVSDDYMARPGHYFYREPLLFDHNDVEAFRFELDQANKELELIRSGVFGDPLSPRAWQSNDGECNAYFKTCEYMKLDNHGLDPGTGMMFEQGDTMHQELENE